ncbi:MAG: WYL domain-containing protein [Acidimicrobiales bacterium]|nr:WYL domain-containing protein [Acidimicrobiales bacterium]
MATPKLERLLDLIAELLHTERPLTAEQLQGRIPGYPEDWDSFKRSFERDKADLREMDIPLRIETVPGTMPAVDGYRIDQEEYGLPDPGLEPDELAAIHLAATAVRLDGADVHTGLRKLGGAIGHDDAVRGSATLTSAPHLSQVFEAVGQHRQMAFRYRDKDRVVDPFRLHHERGHWYVQGHDHDAGQARSFRLDRVQGEVTVGDADSVEVVVDPTQHPIRLDAWAIGEDEPVEAVLRVRPPQATLAARLVGTSAAKEWDEDGSVVLTLPVRSVDGFRRFALSFLDAAEVLGPDALRDDIVHWLEATAQGAD